MLKVTHRDLKPENLLLDSNLPAAQWALIGSCSITWILNQRQEDLADPRHVKIADFGLSNTMSGAKTQGNRWSVLAVFSRFVWFPKAWWRIFEDLLWFTKLCLSGGGDWKGRSTQGRAKSRMEHPISCGSVSMPYLSRPMWDQRLTFGLSSCLLTSSRDPVEWLFLIDYN